MKDLNFHNNAHDGVVYTDSQGRIVYANPYFLSMMEIEDENQILKRQFPEYMWTDAGEAKRLFADIKQDGFVREREMALLNREGQPVFAMCSGVASKDENGNVIGSEIMFCNITSKRKFQAQLLEQIALLDAVLQSTPDPVLVLNADYELERTNDAAQKLFVTSSNKKFLELLISSSADDQIVAAIEKKLVAGEPFDLEISLSGSHFDLHAAPLKSARQGWVCVLHDVTIRKLTQDMLQHHAFHDGLTNLPNRAYFTDRLQRANLRIKHEPDFRYAVLFIDLDGLKTVNDRFGHHTGDELLIEFAKRLGSSIRPADLPARVGGDEFAVLLEDIGDQENALVVATRIRETLLYPYQLREHPAFETTASIGIAISGGEMGDVEMLMRNADQAMYRAKQRGGNSFEIFDKKIMLDANEQAASLPGVAS
ncbi:MAG: diguanylate cyclase domain-containing protein [Anaerolineales bacterium]